MSMFKRISDLRAAAFVAARVIGLVDRQNLRFKADLDRKSANCVFLSFPLLCAAGNDGP